MPPNPLTTLITVLLILISAIISVESRIAVPILEVFAGIIGKNFFNLDFSSSFQYLSFLGLISLMYLAGLEVDLRLMKENFRKGSILGLSTFFIPFFVISFLSFFFLPSFQGDWEKALITGIVLSITSLAVVYPILKESGFLKTEVGRVILGSAAFSEIMGMLILSFFFLEISVFTLLSIFIFVISIYTLPDISKFLLKRYQDKVSEVELKFILVLLLGIATLSKMANIEVAISAFFLGVITSEVIKDYSELEKKLRSLVFGFLSPFFFFEIGLEITPEFILPNLSLILSLFIIAYLSNFLATFFSARKIMPTHTSYISYLFTIPLPVGLLAGVLAYQSGIYDEALYASIIIVILASSILSSFKIGRKRCGLDMICDVY